MATQKYMDGYKGPDCPLPTILCLHGGGTNSDIYNMQTIRLQRALADTFHFIFVDGPVAAQPGPGVLPVFEGCEPFLRWSGSESGPIPAESLRIIKDAITERQKKAEIVGVMGFSQGGKVAAGLFHEQEGFGTNFKFGIFLNSTSPPLTDTLAQKQAITIPSIHVVGSQDPWRLAGVSLYEDYFDKQTAKMIELDIGHRLPSEAEGTEKIVSEIRRLHQETMAK